MEVIQRSSEFLARKGVESPRLQIELLLAHLLEVPRLKLYLDFNRTLTEAQLERLRGLVQRRGLREPLQHIIGSTCFCGLEMVVTRDVLIPRPETELLVERAWNFLGKLVVPRQSETKGTSPTKSSSEREGAARVLDFGTGSGCLAITLAIKQPQAEIHALDISEAALKVACENARRHRVEERVHFHVGDGFSALPGEIQFDLLVSNPPYIPTAEIQELEPEVREHDPHQALDGGKDGLDFYRRFAADAHRFLALEGRLMTEFGDGQEEALREIFAPPRWHIEGVEKDYSQRPRVFTARRGC